MVTLESGQHTPTVRGCAGFYNKLQRIYSSLETLRLLLRVTDIAIRCQTRHNPTLVVCCSLNNWSRNKKKEDSPGI